MMADPIWLLGPSGDLRPLVCPEKDFEITPVRFGGIHQGLSGALSLDVTGFRMRYTFDFKYLDQSEYAWLKALHYRLFRGPFRLISPLGKNRLTSESSAGMVGAGTAQGVVLTSGLPVRVYDWPSAAGTIGQQATRWDNRSGTSVARFDSVKRTTVIPGETVVASVWLKSSLNQNMSMVIDWFDRSTQISSTSIATAAMTSVWTRFSVTGVVPAGAHSARFAIYTSNTTSVMHFTAAQFEAGSVPTSWEQGGSAPIVLMDQLPTTSPRFPYRNTTLSLLEA
jgi:hypothetical protein